MAGNAAPPKFKAVVPPVVVTAAGGMAAAWMVSVVGASAGATSFPAALRLYLTRGVGGTLGPGDVLMSFLGCVILSFGFRIFEQARGSVGRVDAGYPADNFDVTTPAKSQIPLQRRRH